VKYIRNVASHGASLSGILAKGAVDVALRGKFVFVTGGARSGKSSFAESKAADLGCQVNYIATCVPQDEEMKERVLRHQDRRPAHWQTIEEAYDPAEIIHSADETGKVFLLDCLTLLLTNWMLRADTITGEDQWDHKFHRLAAAASNSLAHVVIVSNEVGWGIVPEDSFTRLYRDVLGRANQIMATYADEVYLTVAGVSLELKALSVRK
jgi:adenosylcobinamide kinase/adenosylcobinamide-phosphate guanylyltransferase